MSEARRRTRMVYDSFCAVAATGVDSVRPGDIVSYLRNRSEPFGAWDVRGELTNLEALGLIVLDEESGTWRSVEGTDFDIAIERGNGDIAASG